MACEPIDAKRRKAIELYLGGLSGPATAKIIGSDHSFVYKALKSAGIPNRGCSGARSLFYAKGGHPANFRADVDNAAMAEDYQQMSATQVGEKYGINRAAVIRRLRSAGFAIRTAPETRSMINREKAATLAAQRRARSIGWGEQILAQWLKDRGECPDAQLPVGTRNIDLAIYPVAVEVWTSSTLPFRDPYCRERIKYLSNLGWASIYVHVRHQILLPIVADQIVKLCQRARSDPAAKREHRVIRGCGELAAAFGDDFDHVAIIPPSESCPYHSRVNRRSRR